MTICLATLHSNRTSPPVLHSNVLHQFSVLRRLSLSSWIIMGFVLHQLSSSLDFQFLISFPILHWLSSSPSDIQFSTSFSILHRFSRFSPAFPLFIDFLVLHQPSHSSSAFPIFVGFFFILHGLSCIHRLSRSLSCSLTAPPFFISFPVVHGLSSSSLAFLFFIGFPVLHESWAFHILHLLSRSSSVFPHFFVSFLVLHWHSYSSLAFPFISLPYRISMCWKNLPRHIKRLSLYYFSIQK